MSNYEPADTITCWTGADDGRTVQCTFGNPQISRPRPKRTIEGVTDSELGEIEDSIQDGTIRRLSAEQANSIIRALRVTATARSLKAADKLGRISTML